MNKNFLLAQDICIEHASKISGIFNLSDGMGRMLALLFMTAEPISIPAICEKLSLTKGTVSLYLRLLEERKIIARSYAKRQGKQKFYEVNPGLWSDFFEDLRSRARKKFAITEDAIERGLQAIRKGEKDYRGEDRLISKLLSERLERLRQINNISRAMLDRALMLRGSSGLDASSLKKISFSED
jgi:DNA-binding transcriptional regulator GbsR (MarR family)